MNGAMPAANLGHQVIHSSRVGNICRHRFNFTASSPDEADPVDLLRHALIGFGGGNQRIPFIFPRQRDARYEYDLSLGFSCNMARKYKPDATEASGNDIRPTWAEIETAVGTLSTRAFQPDGL